jgi:hypothetical protein
MTTIWKQPALVWAAVSLLGLFAGSGAAQARSYAHLDHVARQLQRQARDLHDEVHAHFCNTRLYRHLDQHVAEMERLAAHLHEVAHRRGSILHLRADVSRLDRLYHDVEDLVDALARYREVDRRALTHLRRNLAQIGCTLHHLQDDLDRQSYRPYLW